LFGAGLSRRQLLRDDIGLSVASQYRFLELAATEANDQLLGLHVAAEMDLRDKSWPTFTYVMVGMENLEPTISMFRQREVIKYMYSNIQHSFLHAESYPHLSARLAWALFYWTTATRWVT
jgi:hypothetical protein